MSYRLGVDAGGTFTDFVLADDRGHILFKATSTPEDGTKAIAEGAQIAERLGKPWRNPGEDRSPMRQQHHRGGSTLIAGRQDGPHLHRGPRRFAGDSPRSQGRGLSVRRRIPRRQDLGGPPPAHPVRERVLADGSVRTPLNEADVRAACEVFQREGVQAVAIVPVERGQHRAQRTAEIVREMPPGVYVSVGTGVSANAREYTRTSTTVVNAYLGPVLAAYVDRIDAFYKAAGVKVPVRYFRATAAWPRAR